MNLSLPKILDAFPEFNRRSHNEVDFWEAVFLNRFDVVERPQKRQGYYVADWSGDFIFIDSRLTDYRWLNVAFHELTHGLLHIPSPFLYDKHEFEAYSFSVMMLCPLAELDSGSDMRKAAKYNHEIGFLLRKREQIYFDFKDFGIKNDG